MFEGGRSKIGAFAMAGGREGIFVQQMVILITRKFPLKVNVLSEVIDLMYMVCKAVEHIAYN